MHKLFCSNHSRNDCDMISMASRPWANTECPMHKIFIDFVHGALSENPNFY